MLLCPLHLTGQFIHFYLLLFFKIEQNRKQNNIFLSICMIFNHLFEYVSPKLFNISSRIHSVFVLRLFNDPVAVLLVYAAINLFLDNHWTLGEFIILLYSLSINIYISCVNYLYQCLSCVSKLILFTNNNLCFKVNYLNQL